MLEQRSPFIAFSSVNKLCNWNVQMEIWIQPLVIICYIRTVAIYIDD